MTFGISSKNPLDYTGPQLNTVPIRRFPRRPLTTDRRYNIGQIVVLGPSPATGSEGEIWYLSRFSGGSAIWLQLSSGGTVSGIDFIESDDGAPACPPDATGTIGIIGSNGIVTSGQSPTTDITIALESITSTAAGEITMPNTPAFLARLAGNNAGVTGDGTAHTIVYDTEVFDQNADFNGTTTFTAPVTGRYRFSWASSLGSLTAAHTYGALRLITSNRTYTGQGTINVGAIRIPTNYASLIGSALTDMDAADTATVQVQVTNGALVVDVVGNAAIANTYFCGELSC